MSFFRILAMEATSITCVIFAGLLALQGLGGWGWFLGVAVLTTVSTYKTEQSK